jgi:agmatinase
LTHGTPFRRAAEEGLFVAGHSAHVGIRGALYSPDDLDNDAELGFTVVHCSAFESRTVADVVEQLRSTIGDHPLYVSIDIDVLDPAHAPATGTPEIGGLSSRELLGLVRGFEGLNLVGADIVEVAPAYDHAEITGIAAAYLAYEFVSLLAQKASR